MPSKVMGNMRPQSQNYLHTNNLASLSSCQDKAHGCGGSSRDVFRAIKVSKYDEVCISLDLTSHAIAETMPLKGQRQSCRHE